MTFNPPRDLALLGPLPLATADMNRPDGARGENCRWCGFTLLWEADMRRWECPCCHWTPRPYRTEIADAR